MLSPLLDPATGARIEKALIELLGVVKIIASSKTRDKELKEKLLLMKLTIDQISGLDTIPGRGNQLKDLQVVLPEGIDLVENLEKLHSFDVFRKYRYGKKIREFQRKFSDFLLTQVPLNAALEVQKLDADFRAYFQRFGNENNIALARMVNDFFDQKSQTSMPKTTVAQQAISCASYLPDAPPKFAVGLNDCIRDVEQILLQEDFKVVAIVGMGGIGKTTLAKAIFQDSYVKGSNRPAVVVLDDVLSISENLFEEKGYKTIITTRQDPIIPITGSTCVYRMNRLGETNALSLFCYWAFGQTSIPTTANQKLVKQVAAKCNGLPLALMVFGSCLRGEPPAIWRYADEKLPRTEHKSEFHRDGQLLNCLEIIIDILDDVQKQCFLDLGAFPKGGKFSAHLLLNIWVYVHGMEWQDAFVVLFELAKRNLINLTGNIRSGAVEYSCASELFFFQHGLMRDLALRLASQGNIVNRKRFFMPCKDDNIPIEWLSTMKNQTFGAQFLSIHTGAMQEQDWCQIHFPEVEALALFFEGEQYCLPPFLQTMPKLKVLILYNCSSQYATLSGLPTFPSTVQIRSLLLNKLRVPPLYNNYRSLEALEKLAVFRCEGLGNMTLLDKEAGALNFPNMKEINIDHCIGLRKLPDMLCNLTSLQRLSVTDCPRIRNLPDHMGNLSSLMELDLSACTNLLTLPTSICELSKLKYLNLSLCVSLMNLPSDFEHLSNLQTLDIRECSVLENAYTVKLKSLKRVMISDPEVEGEWLTIPNVTVDVVVERFSLDWLDE